jgi:hypothetical protein
MEPTEIQFLLNIVAITAVTSFAVHCYLLKRESRKLASHPEVPPAESAATVEQDIRAFTSARRTGWVKTSRGQFPG